MAVQTLLLKNQQIILSHSPSHNPPTCIARLPAVKQQLRNSAHQSALSSLAEARQPRRGAHTMVVMLSGGSAQANCTGAGAVQALTRLHASVSDVRCTCTSHSAVSLLQALKSHVKACRTSRPTATLSLKCPSQHHITHSPQEPHTEPHGA
jgi:hypothetical protein